MRLEIRGKAALSSEREGKEASSSVPGVPASQKGVATTSQPLDRAACPGLWVPREGACPSDTPGLLGLTAEALSLMHKHTLLLLLPASTLAMCPGLPQHRQVMDPPLTYRKEFRCNEMRLESRKSSQTPERNLQHVTLPINSKFQRKSQS